MPRYEQQFNEISSLADSKRITDRKKCITKLKELYDSSEAIEELHSNSRQRNGTGVNWTSIMHSVHKVLLYVVDEKRPSASTSKSSRAKDNESINRTNYSNTMLETIKKANSSEIVLKCDDLVSLVLQILSSRKYVDYHKAYLNILLNHVLAIKEYQMDMSYDQWKELLETCKTLYENVHPCLNKSLILENMCLIVKHGCTQSHLALHLKESFPFLVKVFEDAKTDLRNLSNDTFELINAVCEAIGTESRVALCGFGETILKTAIHMNGSAVKYDWILLVVRAHHPGGATQNDDGSYACDWNTWNNILRSIYVRIINNCTSEFVSDSFVQLACEVSWQLKDDLTPIDDELRYLNESTYTQPSKRRRTVIGIQGMIDSLTAAPRKESKICVQILIALIMQYPKSIKHSNFLPLMEFLIDYLNTCKDHDVMDQLWELGQVMVQLEGQLLNGLSDNNGIKLSWEKVWGIALRSVTTNKNEDRAHKLLQSLISNKKVVDTSAFLNSYLKDTVKWSKSSVHTLLTFCKHNIMKDFVGPTSNESTFASTNRIPVKLQLLQWVLAVPHDEWNAQFPIEDVSELLVGLTLKSWSTIDQSIVPNASHQSKPRRVDLETKHSICSKRLGCDLTNVERTHLLTAIESDLLEETDAGKNISQSHALRDNVLYVKENRDLLIRDLIERNVSISESKLHFLIVQTAVIAKVFSNFEQLNIASETVRESLGTIVTSSLQEISLEIDEMVKSKKKLKRNLLNVLEALYLFYKTPYENAVAEIIRSSTEFKLLQNILRLTVAENLCKTDRESEMDDGNTSVAYIKDMTDLSDRHRFFKTSDHSHQTDSLSDQNSIRMKACTILATFCGMVKGSGMSRMQENLQMTLLKPDNYDLVQIFDFRMAVTVLETLTDFEVSKFSGNIVERSLKLLQNLSHKWHKDEKASRIILNILSKLFIHLNAIGNDIQRQNSLRFLDTFHEFLKRNKYGPMMYVTYIRCLETIARIDPVVDWTNSPKGAPVVEDLLEYLRNPFHVVRLKAINCLRILFASEDVSLMWLRDFFIKVRTVVTNLFVVRGELTDKVKEDERRNRTASALHMMAVVTSASAIFRSQALLSIFQLTVDKNVNSNIVKKVLERITISLRMKDSNSLIENNLNYLLTHWIEKEYSLHKFPIVLINCESELQFYHKYMNIVVPVLIQQGKLKDGQDVCTKFGKSFKEVVEDSFPRLISWLLPHISANPSAPPAGIGVIDIRHATEVFNLLIQNQDEFQSVQKISTLLEKNLESVIITIIKHLHDEEHSMRFFTHLTISVTYPASDPPHFRHGDIKRSFKYLEDNIIRESDSLMRILATTKQDVLQKVLLNLKCSIHEADSVEHRLKALHHYAYFCMMLLEKIDHEYFDEMSAYVVREISYTLIYFMKSNVDSVSQAACSYFNYFLKRILPKRHEEIIQNLRLIITSLIPIVRAGKSKHACDIMKFLIAEKNDVLWDAIKRLDSFPTDNVFKEVRDIHCNLKDNIGTQQSLETEIQHFLDTRGESTEYCNFTELDHLKKQLSTRKTELKGMYQCLESMHRFSEDYASSKLHRLICALVKLTRSSVSDISLRAAKCLGELGPADLSTMILQPENNQLKRSTDLMLLFTNRVLVLLSNLLIHSDVQLFTSTSDALYIVMASYWGQKISVKKTLTDLKFKIQGSEELLRMEYIRPFVTKANQSRDTNAIDKTRFNNLIGDKRELWIGSVNSSHRDWISNITCNVLVCFKGSYLKHLIPVCRANVSFCEQILPWIIYLVIHIEKTLSTKICDNINSFFKYHYSTSSEFRKNVHQNGSHIHTCFNHESVQCMLNVVDFIRSQSMDNCQFELNYLHVSKAAQYCSAYFTSVLYAELWCEKFLRKSPSIDYLTSIDYICEKDIENGRDLQEILREAYVRIGDPDAIYGCGASYFQDPSAKIEHYIQLRKWDKVLLAHDIELSLGNKTATKGLLDALRHSGLQYLLGAFVNTVDKGEEDIDGNYRYECAWRLSDWNLPTNQQIINLQQDTSVGLQNIVSNDYPLLHYHALKSFHECDTDGLKSSLDNARLSIINTLRNISLESCKTIYPALSQLQMLREIEEIYFAKPDEYNLMIKKWNDQDSIGVDDFEYIEPILSQRTILLQAKGADDSQVIKDALVDTYLQVTELSKKYGYFQMAAKALCTLAKQDQLSTEVTDVLQYQEAILSWMRGDQELGRHLLRNLLVKDSLSLDINAQALKVYGNWMAETKSENPQKVIDKYYLKSLECSKRIINPTPRDKKNTLDTHAALAQFADAQYQQIVTYVKSSQFERFKECVAYSEATAGRLSTTDGDEKRAAYLNKKQSSNDIVELENIEREKNMYLLLALEHYIQTLQQGEDHNLLVFRLVSLWLDNMQHTELSELLEAQLDNLPSYKFVLLVPQLAPHMTDTDDMFSTQIYNLLKRCAIEHPHHTLPVLFSLMNLHKDYEFIKGKKKPNNNPEPRVLGAKKLIEHMMSTDIYPIIHEMCKLAHSLIMLANFETPQAVSQKTPVPKNSGSIMQVKNLEHTLVPTLSIDIKPNKVYDQIITVHKYDSSFELVGGINAPKKITCLGSDGKKRNQLVKGKDDLRQDAVMQQVFTVMNMLLRTGKGANKRKLSVRTYKVVPLTQRCGILEWCDNTMPIGQILEGSSKSMGLHEKYYPADDHNVTYTIKQCKLKMRDVSQKTNEEKLRVFMDCCQHLHPVFHYFFLETFSSPEIWFERRLAYVHSVATTSIIGYILGLGDRHVNNILVDKATAEVIHIDFGIAFEQGKVLPTPETVPFRLTRDIEAAMGVSGVEGVLRRSCEETMTVLRYNRQVILTLLQVLLHDPLFTWAITPAKAYSMQKGSMQGSSERGEVSGETNKLAERALLRLDQKLRGTEEGSASSVAGQVEKLIQEARDPVNLCRLYFGWQPYL